MAERLTPKRSAKKSVVQRELPKYEVLRELARKNGGPPRAVAAFVTLSIFSTELADAAGQHFARFGLSQGRFVILISLYCEPGNTMTPLALARHAGVAPATVTGLLEGLERHGYIARVHQEDDRRVVKVHLLPKGRALLVRLLPTHFRRIAKAMEGLTTSDFEALTRILGIIRGHLSALRDP